MGNDGDNVGFGIAIYLGLAALIAVIGIVAGLGIGGIFFRVMWAWRMSTPDWALASFPAVAGVGVGLALSSPLAWYFWG